jgi:hypothetical protein
MINRAHATASDEAINIVTGKEPCNFIEVWSLK